MALYERRSRSRSRLLGLSAARRDLGLEQCGSRERWRRDAPRRHALRFEMHARDAGGVPRGGARGAAHRHAGQYPFERRPHLRQSAGRGRRDHRVTRLRRGDAGAAAGRAGGDDAQLARARPRARLFPRGDGDALRLRGDSPDAADAHLRRRGRAPRRRQRGARHRGRPGAYRRRRHRRMCRRIASSSPATFSLSAAIPCSGRDRSATGSAPAISSSDGTSRRWCRDTGPSPARTACAR